MSAAVISIIEQLQLVDRERAERARQPALLAAVQALKHYQQRRFTHTYADLLASPRYGPASRFFLDELYGPTDFSQRDAQFQRVVPALVRLFPGEIVHTVATLARLHAVSELLDSAMGRQLFAANGAIDGPIYLRAWQAADHAALRETQIALTVEVGSALDRYTRRPLLRHTLRMMRGPAKAAGLGELQRFLEAGFDAFKAMKGAAEFLSLVGRRERDLAAALFRAAGDDAEGEAAAAFALRHLP